MDRKDERVISSYECETSIPGDDSGKDFPQITRMNTEQNRRDTFEDNLPAKLQNESCLSSRRTYFFIDFGQ